MAHLCVGWWDLRLWKHRVPSGDLRTRGSPAHASALLSLTTHSPDLCPTPLQPHACPGPSSTSCAAAGSRGPPHARSRLRLLLLCRHRRTPPPSIAPPQSSARLEETPRPPCLQRGPLPTCSPARPLQGQLPPRRPATGSPPVDICGTPWRLPLPCRRCATLITGLAAVRLRSQQQRGSRGSGGQCLLLPRPQAERRCRLPCRCTRRWVPSSCTHRVLKSIL